MHEVALRTGCHSYLLRQRRPHNVTDQTLTHDEQFNASSCAAAVGVLSDNKDLRQFIASLRAPNVSALT